MGRGTVLVHLIVLRSYSKLEVVENVNQCRLIYACTVGTIRTFLPGCVIISTSVKNVVKPRGKMGLSNSNRFCLLRRCHRYDHPLVRYYTSRLADWSGVGDGLALWPVRASHAGEYGITIMLLVCFPPRLGGMYQCDINTCMSERPRGTFKFPNTCWTNAMRKRTTLRHLRVLPGPCSNFRRCRPCSSRGC